MKQAPVCVALLGLALAACTDTTPPDSALPSAPIIAAAPPVGPCSFRDAQSLAKAYFATAALRRSAGDFLRSAEQAAVGSLARNNALVEVSKLIAQAYANNQDNAPLDGAKLHSELLDCGGFVVTDNRDHLAVVTSALTEGAYAYRAASEGPVVSANLEVAAEPANGDWAAWIGGRAIVFAGKVNVDYDEAEVDEGQTYRWGLVYDATPPGNTPGPSGDDDALIVEFCQRPLDLTDDPAFRVGRQRGNGVQTVLEEIDIAAGFCDVTASAPRPSGIFARALHGMLGFIVPSPLQARMVLAPPGVGGGTGGLGSDFALVHAGFVRLAYVTQPLDGTTTPGVIHFEVRALAENLTPLENVVLVVIVDGNQGQPVTLTGGCQPTDEAGLASCDVSINKTGGYRLRVTSDFPGYPPVFIISDLFNLQQF